MTDGDQPQERTERIGDDELSVLLRTWFLTATREPMQRTIKRGIFMMRRMLRQAGYPDPLRPMVF